MKKIFNKCIIAAAAACSLSAMLLLSGCAGSQASKAVSEAAESVVSEASSAAESAVSEAVESAAAEASSAVESAVSDVAESVQSQIQSAADEVLSSDDEEESSETGKSAADIYSALKEQVSLPDLMELPSEYVLNYYGIDTSKYPDSFFAMSEDATSAETIIFVRTSGKDEAEELKESLQNILDQKAEEMENYLPEQYKIVSASSVTVDGNDVYLIISDQEPAIRSIIESNL